ncbi:MAG: hypothetical protein E6Q67_03050 [Roseateles sp.]|nr:MAG: hypothetical protein E6Q67_03050 [Roseateles sp.]
MNTNVWLDAEVTKVLQDARDKLERLGATVLISPASVPNEGVVAALYVSSSQRAVQATDVAFEMGVESIASRDSSEFGERVMQRLEDQAAEDAAAAGR